MHTPGWRQSPYVLDADDPRLEVRLEEHAQRRSEDHSILTFPRFTRPEGVIPQCLLDVVSCLGYGLAESRITLHPDLRQVIHRSLAPDDLKHHRDSR